MFREICCASTVLLAVSNLWGAIATVTTTAASGVNDTGATLGGNVASDGGATVTQRGIVYSTVQNPTTSSGTFVTAGSGTGSFSAVLNGPLSPGTTYYVRAFATNSAGTAYGTQISFTTTTPVVLPTVTTMAESAVNDTGATLGGNVTADGGAAVTQRGVVYSTAPNPTTSSGTFITVGSGTGSFSTVLNGSLSPGTTYHVRAFATNSAGTGYGSDVPFTTLTANPNPAAISDSFDAGLDVINRWEVVGGTWSTSGGQLTGFWSQDDAYTDHGKLLLRGRNLDDDFDATFVATLNNGAGHGFSLYDSAHNLYNVNVANSGVFVEKRLNTPDGSPFIQIGSGTHTVSATSPTTARLSRRGAVFSVFLNGTKVYEFTDTTWNGRLRTGLKVYGTAIFDSYEYISLAPVATVPTVSTAVASSVNDTGATLGGTVTADGGATVTQRGIVYSMAQNPTTSTGTFIVLGSGMGSFSTVLNGPLSLGTAYYVRAFATNSAGTAYGNQIGFTTTTLVGDAVLFADDFSGSLSGWTAMTSDVGATWQIQNGNLIGDYTIGAGSTFNTQAFLLLNDALQPTGDWAASVDFTVADDLSDPAFKKASVSFGIWAGENAKLSITLGRGGWNWAVGPQSSIDIGISLWKDVPGFGSYWEGTDLDRTVTINWDPSAWNTARLEKRGATYKVFLNGTELHAFTDTFLNGVGKIGLHTYGTKKLDNFHLEAISAPTSSTITVAANPLAGGIVSGAGTFAVGSTQTLTATANTGYTFTDWADGNTSSPRQIIVPAGGATYTANFAVVPLDAQGPAVAVNGAVVAANGRSVAVAGTATDSGRGGNGVASVTVAGVAASGLPVNGNATANWSATVPVSAGARSVSVIAKDSSDNTTTILSTVTVPSVVSLSAGTHTSLASGESYTTDVAANTTWSAASDQSWATVSPTNGSGDGTVTVTVSANTTTSSRTATITIGSQTHSLTQSPLVPSRIISLAWGSNGGVFGDVVAGSSSPAPLTISNTGNSPMTVTSITYPAGFSGNWSAGSIAAGASQVVTVTFAPSEAVNYVGGISVFSDATSGTAATPVSGAGITGNSGSVATHAVQGPGYVPGGMVTITNTVTYTGAATGLGWQVLLPAGWSYASGGGSEGDVRPAAGTTDLLEWAWTSIPSNPVAFTYTLNVPASATGSKPLAALAIVRQGASPVQVLAAPDPLSVPQVVHHHADTSFDGKISLLELTRVIELYNTRNGTARTGCYKVQTGTEDGFAADPARLATEVVATVLPHSADSNHDGKLSLLELTRVIELYNYRVNTTRTGQYHAQSGTEDGFAPGPIP